ncbi:hypothetical protein VTN77DRAFT_4930 [Rasamsonia byssochlamydoides]|uniref:uncharacterized protein n=1 Tax=Rasamsonia byssochlamydoides TaxID=89139 RepID=UPI0037431C61
MARRGRSAPPEGHDGSRGPMSRADLCIRSSPFQSSDFNQSELWCGDDSIGSDRRPVTPSSLGLSGDNTASSHRLVSHRSKSNIRSAPCFLQPPRRTPIRTAAEALSGSFASPSDAPEDGYTADIDLRGSECGISSPPERSLGLRSRVNALSGRLPRDPVEHQRHSLRAWGDLQT